MLTPRQNFEATISGGKADRFVNQFEALRFLLNPFFLHNPLPVPPGSPDVQNLWGVTFSWPVGQPGPYPVHSPASKIVIQDIEKWQDYVHAPALKFPEEEWDMIRQIRDSVDTNLACPTSFFAPGLFELSHHLGEISNTFANLIMYEDEMHDLIKYLVDFELRLAELICEKIKPECVFHHDDWGSRTAPFFSNEMFEDFFIEPYKELYGYYKTHGVKYVIHHSDSYGVPYVPAMVEMGIDVWQGCMCSNNLPDLVKQYRGKITFMGGFDGADYDTPDWNADDIRKRVFAYLDQFDSPEGFIPCVAQGGPGSVNPGVYETIFDAIDDYNVQRFGICKDEIERIPMQLENEGYM